MAGQIRWGPSALPRSAGTEHFLVVGASGSGKTTLLKMMMRSVFETEHEFTGLVYDPKQELLPLLFSLRDETEEHVRKGTSSIRVLNPFDARCCAWDLSRDIDNPVSARQLATILVPEGAGAEGNQAFFVNAVRDILTGVILVFVNCAKEGCRWTLRDLLLGVLYQPYLTALLGQTKKRDGKDFPLVSRLQQTYLEGRDPRTLSNILSTMSSRLSVFEPVAAAWHRAEKRGPNFTFSLKDWAAGEFTDVLVLGNDEAGRAAIDPINQAIFKRATELLLARKETSDEQKASGEGQTWFFLDEVREAGALDGLSRLLTKGRSKGACVVLSFQDIEGMRDAYGNEVANEICGQCNNTIVLRLNSPATAQWASQLFGNRLTLSESGGTQSSGLQVSAGFQEQERSFLQTAHFTYLPTAGRRNGLTGYLRNPEIAPDKLEPRWTLPPPDVARLLPKDGLREGELSESVELRPEWLYLEAWDKKDWERLGFKGPLPPWDGVDREDEQSQGPPPSGESPTTGEILPRGGFSANNM